MNKYFFDSYAIIEIIKGNSNYENFKDEIFLTTAINLSEVYYHLLNEAGEQIANEIIKKLNMEFINITPAFALEAASFRHKYNKKKLSYVDCLGYVIAKNMRIKFLTGDEGFKDTENVEFVK